MIGHLRGTLLEKTPQEVVVDVGGVGYRVSVPVSTFCRLGDPGDAVTLRIHTHVREDTLALFGFLTSEEHAMFTLLIGVSGVGPRLALGVLSGIDTADLAHALREGDLARLTRIPGVGKKTAERLVLELRDKVTAPTTPPPTPSDRGDLLSALVNLGYPRPAAQKALAEVPTDHRFEDALRAALRLLSR